MQRTGRVLEEAREALRDGEPPRQEDAEGRPASAGTLELDSTVMGFDDLPHHEQSEPHARVTTRPAQQLIGFARLDLEPGEAETVTFVVPLSLLAYTGLSG